MKTNGFNKSQLTTYVLTTCLFSVIVKDKTFFWNLPVALYGKAFEKPDLYL